MYQKLKVIDYIMPKAEEFIMENDRELYIPLFRVLEKYCSENSIMIGGAAGIGIALGQPFSREITSYKLYTDNVWETSKHLANKLYDTEDLKFIPKYTINVETIVKHRETVIWCNLREIARVHAVDTYKGVKLIDVVDPELAKGYFHNVKVKIVPSDMHLIDIYKRLGALYPRDKKRYEDLLKIEEKLYPVGMKQLDAKATTVGGDDHVGNVDYTSGDKYVGGAGDEGPVDVIGRGENNTGLTDDTDVDGGSEYTSMDNINQKILFDVVKPAADKYIIAGDYAIEYLLRKPPNSKFQRINHKRLQIIMSDSGVKGAVTQMEKATGKKLTYTKFGVNIPSDPLVTKHTVYINDNGQTPLLDIFNITDYQVLSIYTAEIIPGCRVGILRHFPLLRVEFMNIWLLRLVLNMGKTGVKSIINNKISYIKQLHNDVVTLLKDSPKELFPQSPTDYRGTYTDELFIIKKRYMEATPRMAKYYPARNDQVFQRESVDKSNDSDADDDVENDKK